DPWSGGPGRIAGFAWAGDDRARGQAMIEEVKRQAAIAAEAKRQGIPEWMAEATRAVPDQLVRDIVGDHLRSSARSRDPAAPAVRGNGWVEPRPLEPRPAFELGLIDRLCEKFIGGANSIK